MHPAHRRATTTLQHHPYPQGKEHHVSPTSTATPTLSDKLLTGLEKVAVTGDGLRAALTQGGIPCTVDELKTRFDKYVADLTRGKSVAKVRVVVE